ncbi:MAG: gliding motility-associated C-terminal domain-containing protein [Taibaiella sp.]|nr:gliding motility-associated C-terminal domain-containing protein [Taibaiella sp.]
MKNSYTLLAVLILTVASCKKVKHNETQTQLSPFAQSLKASCTAPFKGKGDALDVYLPTAITPDGNGINDTYGLAPVDCNFTSFSLDIYDTTGIRVYHSGTPSGIIWDGTDMNTGHIALKYKYYVKVAYTTQGNITDSGSTYLFLLPHNDAKTCIIRMAADTMLYLFPSQFVIGSGFDRINNCFEHFCD